MLHNTGVDRHIKDLTMKTSGSKKMLTDPISIWMNHETHHSRAFNPVLSNTYIYIIIYVCIDIYIYIYMYTYIFTYLHVIL